MSGKNISEKKCQLKVMRFFFFFLPKILAKIKNLIKPCVGEVNSLISSVGCVNWYNLSGGTFDTMYQNGTFDFTH